MQPLDPADKRQPNVKIAASIRAAILSGELEPGERLPSGPELARFFGVAGMTVQRAIRTLADEGFVRTKSGSGVYVRDQAGAAAPEEAEHPLAGAAAFLFEMGHLKRTTRAGWLLLGIAQPETVAEHSFRVGVTGIVLAGMEGADVGRTAALCLMHDTHETRIGDVPSVGRAYITSAAPEAVSAHQTAAMPNDVAKVLQDLKAEYEVGETAEARVARDADKLETLLQAVEYEALGHDTAAWQETSVDALRTDSARQLAQAITSADPHSWWSAFAASYRELRASAQDRARRLEPRGTGPTGQRQPIVAAIVTSARGVLVGRRNDGKPSWTFIAGEQEPGEQPEDTAIREVKEETGLRIQAGQVIGERVHPNTGRTMIYMAAAPTHGTDVFVGDEDELAEVRWVSLPEADELLPGMFEPVREHLARELGEV